MAIDASIYGQARLPEPFNPLAELAQMQQLQALTQQNKLAQLQFGDRERALADAAAQRTAVQGFGADTTANYNALLRTGNLGAAQGYQKGLTEQAQAQSITSKNTAETKDKVFGTFKSMAGALQNPQEAAAFVMSADKDPVLGPMLAQYGPIEQRLKALQDAVQSGKFEHWKATLGIGIEKLAQLAKTQNVNLGGTMQTQMVQPATGQVSTLASAPITQSADNRASQATALAGQRSAAATAAAGHALQERLAQGQVTYQQDAEGNMIALPSRAAPGAMVRGQPVVTGPGLTPMQGAKGANLTEDQGKATGWLVQATNAFGNMQKAMQTDPSVARPGLPDMVAGIPSMGVGGAVGNMMRGADRQKFLQGASSLSEALLRAATGAGVNKDEAAQKVQELTPVFGEDESVTAQKMAAIPLYIESLKVRAGPGARKAAGIGAGPAAATSADDPLGLRGR